MSSKHLNEDTYLRYQLLYDVKNKNMSYKEEFYNKVSKFNVDELKSFLEKESYSFDQFKKEYDSWKSEEERYKKRLDKLDKQNNSQVAELVDAQGD